MEFRKHSVSDTDSQQDSDYEINVSKRNRSLFDDDDDDLTKKRPRCFSKNALMARENRLRKKLYVEGLERNVAKLTQENRKLKNRVENQSRTIDKLTKEVRYVKNVLANSTDILKILHSIHQNTGMLVGTSLDKSLSFTSYVSKKQQQNLNSSINIEEDGDLFGSFKDEEIDFGVLFNDPELINIEETSSSNTNVNNTGGSMFEEHNYVSRIDDVDNEDNEEENNENGVKIIDKDDVGVCLHVSKHRVSLEFCSKCNDDAAGVWKNDFLKI